MATDAVLNEAKNSFADAGANLLQGIARTRELLISYLSDFLSMEDFQVGVLSALILAVVLLFVMKSALEPLLKIGITVLIFIFLISFFIPIK